MDSVTSYGQLGRGGEEERRGRGREGGEGRRKE